MKNVIICLLFLLSNAFADSLDSVKTEIMEEARLLYRLEKASWYGTDYFTQYDMERLGRPGGYLSYPDGDKVITIFFDRNDSTKILARYTFEWIPRKHPISVDKQNEKASAVERELIALRQKAFWQIMDGRDTLFHFYKDVQFNIIPLANNSSKRVFIISGTNTTGSIPIGGDYLLTYSSELALIKEQQLHKSLLWIQNEGGEASLHSHVLSDFITSTDICTILLYKDYIKWKSHMVISKNFVSLFDVEKELLIIMTRENFDKIYHLDKK